MKLSNHWRGLSGRRALCHWGTLRRRWELSTSAVGHLRRRGGRHAPDPRLRRPPHDNGSDPPRRVHLHAQRWSWGAAELRREDEGRTASGTASRGWTVFETPSTPGGLPSVGYNTSGPDRPWTTVSGSVVTVRRTRERGAASLGLIDERPPTIEDPRNLAGALALRSGQNRVLAWGETPRGRGPASFEMCVPPSLPPPLPLSSPCVGFDLPA